MFAVQKSLSQEYLAVDRIMEARSGLADTQQARLLATTICRFFCAWARQPRGQITWPRTCKLVPHVPQLSPGNAALPALCFLLG